MPRLRPKREIATLAKGPVIFPGPGPWVRDPARHCAPGPDMAYGTEVFFPELGGHGYIQMAIAQSICEGCPFKQPCADYAQSQPQVMGIWGGTTDESRRRARRNGTRRKTSHTTAAAADIAS